MSPPAIMPDITLLDLDTWRPALYAAGKRHDGAAQIMELRGCAAFHYGMPFFARTLAIPGE